MWRDIERRASKYEVPLNVPAPYPLKNFDLASRVAVLGEMEGWCPNYVRASYRRWFVEGNEAGAEPNLSESLSEIGQDPDRVIVAANSETVGHAYDENTNEARRLSIFGSPTFVASEAKRTSARVARMSVIDPKRTLLSAVLTTSSLPV